MKNIIKVIKTKEDYKEALELLEDLLFRDPEPESEEGIKLVVLSKLIQDYELNIFPGSLPDPIEAIRFRMEQQNLKPVDLIPFIGSRGKVSEILSHKRPLTISMIRALEKGLNIPASALLKESENFINKSGSDWSFFPIKEMAARGYFNIKFTKDNINNLMTEFFSSVNQMPQLSGNFRKTHFRSSRPMNKHALMTWSTMVMKKASAIKNMGEFKIHSIDFDFMQKLAKLSIKESGPILAIEELRKNGITLVIEPHFPQTYLDGATIMTNKNNPIIGLTIRQDRLDNFWFTLMHELAHVTLHYNQNINFFYDDLDKTESDKQEKEADNLAGEVLVPASKWTISPARIIPSSLAAESLAKDLNINVAIVAGKMRREGSNYMYLNKIINQSGVRSLFPEIKWKN